MKKVLVPEEETFLVDILQMVQEDGIILQATDGQHYVLLSLADWQAFDVGDSDDFAQEVENTATHQALMAFLAQRRSNSIGKPVPLAEVKRQLGL